MRGNAAFRFGRRAAFPGRQSRTSSRAPVNTPFPRPGVALGGPHTVFVLFLCISTDPFPTFPLNNPTAASTPTSRLCLSRSTCRSTRRREKRAIVPLVSCWTMCDDVTHDVFLFRGGGGERGVNQNTNQNKSSSAMSVRPRPPRPTHFVSLRVRYAGQLLAAAQAALVAADPGAPA